MLRRIAGCKPKPSNSTSPPSPRKGSGSDIGLLVGRGGPDTDRQRDLSTTVKVVDAASHTFFRRPPVQQLERCPDDLSSAVKAEQFCVVSQLGGQVVGDSSLPGFRGACRDSHVYSLPYTP